MCLTPVTIGNPTRRFTDGLSRYTLQVKCNHCKDCIKQQQDDWFVRAFFEYQRVKDIGDAWFVLLTYNDENLPIYEDQENDFVIPCFDNQHLKHFRDTFRMILYRKFEREYALSHDVPTKWSKAKNMEVLDWKSLPKEERSIKQHECKNYSSGKVRDIRFMFCPEYGSDYGRSHYHALIFVPFKLDKQEAIGTRSMQWTDGLFQRAWQYGFVSFSPEHGATIESENGIQYAMKYTTKDCAWYSKYGVDEYKKMLKKAADVPDDLEAQEKYKNFLKVLPRRYQSTHFGIDGINDFKNEDGTFNLEKCVDGRINLSKHGHVPAKGKNEFLYNMPLYYIRKIFYDQDEYGLWQKTEFGLQVAQMRYALRQQRKVEKFSAYLSPQSFIQHLHGVDATDLFLKYHIENEYQLFEHFTTLLAGRSLDSLALYDTVYRGISPDESWITAASGMSADEQLAFFKDNDISFMLAQQHLDREPDPEKMARRVTDKHFYKHHQDFSVFECFNDFDVCMNIIEDCESLVGCNVDEAWREDQAKIAANYEVRQKKLHRLPQSCRCGTKHIYKPYKLSSLYEN